ncbi:MAG: type II secretion system F family protein, partial [Nitrososphaerota archaeon]
MKLTFRDKFVGFFYSRFSTLGPIFLRIFPGITSKLDAAMIRIYPEAYAATVAGLTLITAVICIPLAVVLYFFTGNLLSLALLAVPPIVMLLGVFYPYSQASSIASIFESEVPYAATYLAVMATGGVPPYMSLRRLSKGELMPNLAKIASIAHIKVDATGEDPVSAIEDMVKNVKSKEFKDLLLGYVSTLRSGGDVVHFLIRKTEQIFTSRMGKMRIVGERMGMLMEGYAAITMMLSLVIFTIYIISRALPSEFLIMPSEQFAMIAYLFLPMMSVLFIYLADISQPKYPSTDPRPMRIFYYSIPGAMVFAFFFVFPFFATELQYMSPLDFTSSLIVSLRKLLGLD